MTYPYLMWQSPGGSSNSTWPAGGTTTFPEVRNFRTRRIFELLAVIGLPDAGAFCQDLQKLSR